eukprot:346090-Chlamydomonas_euryale.AAC.7
MSCGGGYMESLGIRSWSPLRQRPAPELILPLVTVMFWIMGRRSLWGSAFPVEVLAVHLNKALGMAALHALLWCYMSREACVHGCEYLH